jgi:hypothetical protein
MFKTSFIGAFALTLFSYAIFFGLQPAVPLSVAETTVVFAFWLGIIALVLWLANRLRRRTKREH